MNKYTKKIHIHLYIFSSPLHQYLKLYLGQNIKKKYLQNTNTIYTYIYLKILYISTLNWMITISK